MASSPMTRKQLRARSGGGANEGEIVRIPEAAWSGREARTENPQGVVHRAAPVLS
jgi:hypothetical protein